MYLEIQGSNWASIVHRISDEQQTGCWNMARGMGVHPYQLCPKVCAGPIVEHFQIPQTILTAGSNMDSCLIRLAVANQSDFGFQESMGVSESELGLRCK